MRVLRSTAAAIAALAGAIAMAMPANAMLPAGDDPVDPPERADLRVSALTVSPNGGAWSLSYTVVNSGMVSAGATTLGFGGGPGYPPAVPIPSLAPGATRSGTLQFTRADCYVVVTATADSGRAVTESNETNNARNATGVVPGCPPRYRVSASSFTAVDESGADWTGSDETFFVFSGVGTTGTAATRATQVYGSIDTGDVQGFSVVDQCAWGCGLTGQQAPFGIGLSVQLWEEDLGNVDEIWFETASAFQEAGGLVKDAPVIGWVGSATEKVGKGLEYILNWADNDLIGTNTYAFGPAGLAAALPSRGMSFTDVRTYTDGDATYTLKMVVSRIV